MNWQLVRGKVYISLRYNVRANCCLQLVAAQTKGSTKDSSQKLNIWENDFYFLPFLLPLKRDPKRRSIMCPIDRNGIKNKTKLDSQHLFSQFMVKFIKIHIWKLHSHECCHLVFFSLCLWHHGQDRHVWNKHLLCHEPTLFNLSLVKSEPLWLHPEELNKQVQ